MFLLESSHHPHSAKKANTNQKRRYRSAFVGPLGHDRIYYPDPPLFHRRHREQQAEAPEQFPASTPRRRTTKRLCARWLRFMGFTHRDEGLDSSMILRRMCLRIQDHSCDPQEILPYQPKPPPHPPMLQTSPASCKVQRQSP